MLIIFFTANANSLISFDVFGNLHISVIKTSSDIIFSAFGHSPLGYSMFLPNKSKYLKAWALFCWKIGSRYKYEKLPIEIYVEDNGNGIAENLKDSIFDPFVTDKVNGKGLGLSIAAKIVNSHNGTIEFDSYSGRTIFKVMFQEGKKI